MARLQRKGTVARREKGEEERKSYGRFKSSVWTSKFPGKKRVRF